jgi:hypothetical protein
VAWDGEGIGVALAYTIHGSFFDYDDRKLKLKVNKYSENNIVHAKLSCLVWCPGQNKRIAPLSSMDVVKSDLRINNIPT